MRSSDHMLKVIPNHVLVSKGTAVNCKLFYHHNHLYYLFLHFLCRCCLMIMTLFPLLRIPLSLSVLNCDLIHFKIARIHFDFPN